MHIHPLMLTLLNLPFPPQEINSAFIGGFYGLKELPNFFTKQMSTFFKTLIEQGFALDYIDDILLLSDSKEHMFQLIEQLHIISTKNNLN